MKARLVILQSSPMAATLGAHRHVEARKAFFKTAICKWIEHHRMSYYVQAEWLSASDLLSFAGITAPVVYLTLTEEQYTLLKMKIDDPAQLSVVLNA